jgi:superfamily II DNA or RNA helicase
MADLFGNLSRTERQEQGVQRWVDNKLCGTLNWATGVGKTRGGLMAISRFLKKNPTKSVIIVVPSEPIQRQWNQELIDWNLFQQCSVKTMNDTSVNKHSCTLLVIDEIHKVGAPTLLNIFKNIQYTVILGLTATFERLDGKDEIISKKCPIVDTISVEEAIENKWLADYREYEVLIEPEDIDVYKEVNKEFYEHFSFFNYDFNLAMKCATDWKRRSELAKERCREDQSEDFKTVNKQILVHAMGFSRTLQARKKYIYNHPKKIELTNLILEHRQDKKCITFSATIAMAEKIKYGAVYSGKDSVKKGRMSLQEFIQQDGGVLNTVMKLNEGFNCPDISVSVILGFNSSSTTKKQRVGRVIRQKEGKVAEVFTLVLKGTVEEEWFRKSTSTGRYIPISEENLIDVLEGRPFNPKKKKQTKMMFRF